MSHEESLESRQKNELEALNAIYGEDLKDLRTKGPRHKWKPLEVLITLKPQQGGSGIQEIHAALDLHVICDENYPNCVPQISFENSKGLSNTILIELKDELDKKAEELKGEEMIFQISQYVQEFLHRHNKPGTKSFYDEMLKRQQKELEAIELQRDRQRQFIQEEVHKREEILKSEQKLRRESRYVSENSIEDEVEYSRTGSFSIRRHNSSFTENEDTSCEHKGTTKLQFHNNNGSREIQRGRCIKHSSENHIIYNGMDLETGALVVISEWIIEIKNNIDENQIYRHISSIEQEINYLVKLKHYNLAHYLNFRHERIDDKIVVHILKDFVSGSTCTSLLISQNYNFVIDFIKHIAKGVLNALDYLHRNNVVHKDIRESCVFINDKGNVKVSNYSIHRRMTDLINHTHGSNNYSKKTDIYNFGKFILSILNGSSVNDDNATEIPTTLPSDLYEFLTRCLCKDEKDRYTAAQLLNHLFLKSVVHSSPKLEEIVMEKEKSPENVQNDLILLSHPQINGQSRINNEFEWIQHLGKGAFGDVIKVKNKLDGGYYAIKRIKLNPKNKQLNKKIVREVKLLSRLNHENVVRYYNSWIETTVITEEDLDSSESISTPNIHKPKVVKPEEFTINDDIEALAPPIKNVEVSITYDSKSQPAYISSSDDEDDSSDEDEDWRTGFTADSDSDSIEFDRGSSQSLSKHSSFADEVSSKFTDSFESQKENIKKIDFMYIQMEFCEKSTLRTAIDNNLYLDVDRVWRLFREIVEGLAHIHQQGMMHRDLKPVNIFLDSEDHVKIGDFGLATSIKTRHNEEPLSKSAFDSDREEDEGKTGAIGTALYVAPELTNASKVIYNEKVDIYSLGIILFEMCYRPLKTTMERIKILTSIRNEKIIFPEDFDSDGNEKQEFIIRWLLIHDTTTRPTSQELLQSEHIPPPVLEECELRELVRHTLSNPQLKGYKYLIASCFKQSITAAQDITYDKDPSAPTLSKPLQLYDIVKQITVKVFKNHGGQNLITPLLMPKSSFYEVVDSYVKLMTHFGGVVSLPHDLRVPFARYVAWNGITLLRRYSIERVYREKKVFGFLPRELYECAFDIVTPNQGNLMSDGELLYIVYEIIKELPGLKNKNVIIRLNHASLLKAILLHCGIKTKHIEILTMFSEVKEGKVPKLQLQTYLISLGLSDNCIATLLGLFSAEYEISKAANQLQMITKKKTGDASVLAKQALQDLKTISQNAEAYGVTFDIVVAPGLVYNVQQYSGMICQFVCELRKKHKHGAMEVLAAGGRYDAMISSFRNIMLQANMLSKDIRQSAVGISISLDKLVQATQKEQLPKIEALDVAVCSVGSKQMVKEKTKILRTLWSAGIRSFLIEATNIEEIQEQCTELKVPHVIMLKDNEQGTVRVRSWDKERFQEKTFQVANLVESMQKILDNWNETTQEHISVSTSLSKSDSSKSTYNEKYEHCHDPNVTVLFVTEDKLSSNVRKRFENQVRSQLESLFAKLTGNVIVLGLTIETNIIRTLASYLEFENELLFLKSVNSVIERHQRHKKYLSDICDEIYDQKTKRTKPIIVLYSLPESFYRVIF